MAYKYIAREMSNDWKLAKYYFPKFDLVNSKIYEIIFSRLSSGQVIEIKLNIPIELRNKQCNLYYSDGKGNCSIVDYEQVDNDLVFSTNKVGLYILLEEKESFEDNKFSQIIFTATNISKSMGLKIERAFLGM